MADHRFHTPDPVELEIKVPSGDIDIETIDGDESVISLDGDESVRVGDEAAGCQNRAVDEGDAHHTVSVTLRRNGGSSGSWPRAMASVASNR